MLGKFIFVNCSFKFEISQFDSTVTKYEKIPSMSAKCFQFTNFLLLCRHESKCIRVFHNFRYQLLFARL